MSKNVKWAGETPKECDLCHKPITDKFVDGSFTGTNHWGIFCPTCYQKLGNGFGLGKGQMYETATGNKILG
jgi:hypothetical protein